LKEHGIPPDVFDGLAAGATLIVSSAQRQAAVRAAWASAQRTAGQVLWKTPSVFTFPQFAERQLTAQWASQHQPDRMLPPGAEWALLRELRSASGGAAEARALHAAIRTLHDWRIPRSAAALGGTSEGSVLIEALAALETQARESGRRPLRGWLDDLTPPSGELLGAGLDGLPARPLETLRRLDARLVRNLAAPAVTCVATAQDDIHELELIAHWCRQQLEAGPDRRLLIVDAKLRQRRRQYERLLSQALSPSEWISGTPRAFSTFFSIEGGQPLTDFPLIAHASMSLRLLTSGLRFDELVSWLRMPFLDRDDVFAGTALEASLRQGRRMDYSAAALMDMLERLDGEASRALAVRLRLAGNALGDGERTAADWAPRFMNALGALGWPGSRRRRSDEQQTVSRVHELLDEYAALGPWLPRSDAAGAVATLVDLSRERSFDPATVAAPVTLTDSHDDPVVRYDGIWVAGLDAAQWPPPPRPDVFIPLGLQVGAGIPAASASGQTQAARRSFAAWQAATSTLVCSWAQLDRDAHRTLSPLLARLPDRKEWPSLPNRTSLASALRTSLLETFDDSMGIAVDTTRQIRGGVKPLALQAECGFHAYGEMRLAAEKLEAPAPGVDARERGMLLHKALELIWIKLCDWFTLSATDDRLRKPMIHQSVEAAVVHVFRGVVPAGLKPAVEREQLRLERLIEKLLKLEAARPAFTVDKLEARREVQIAGGTFELRIDRIDSIEGGGYAILDYKSGEARAPRWDGQKVRDPQLLAYLLAERGRDVQALAHVSLTRGRARFIGKASMPRLLPGVNGVRGQNPAKVPPAQIEAVWRSELESWLQGLHHVAAAYLDGNAAVQPAPDVCRNCHLTVLCRRLELSAVDVGGDDHE